jgi:hypothetical protein
VIYAQQHGTKGLCKILCGNLPAVAADIRRSFDSKLKIYLMADLCLVKELMEKDGSVLPV